MGWCVQLRLTQLAIFIFRGAIPGIVVVVHTDACHGLGESEWTRVKLVEDDSEDDEMQTFSTESEEGTGCTRTEVDNGFSG